MNWLRGLKVKRAGFGILLVLLAVTLTGCIWTRLLSFKNQLGDIDHTARIVEDTNGMTLHFKKPVLYGEDLFIATQSEPSTITTNGSVETWAWVYNKVPRFTNTAPEHFDLQFEALVVDEELEGLRFPPQVLAVLPKEMLLGLFRAVGRGKIDRSHKSLAVDWNEAGPKKPIEPLTRAQVTNLLGTPFYANVSNDVYSCFYKYRYSGKDPDNAWAKFVFAPNSDKVSQSQGAFGNVGWTLKSEPGKPGMKVDLWLAERPPAWTNQLDARLMQEFVGHYRDEAGQVLRVGEDSGRLAMAGGLQAIESDKSGWWLLQATSPTNFVGREFQCTFVCDGQGHAKELLVGEQGFFERYTKVLSEAPRHPRQVAVDPQTLKAYVGRYKFTNKGEEFFYEVSLRGNQLLWEGVPIYPASERDFFFKLVESRLTFVQDGQGRVVRYDLHFDKQNLPAVKVAKK